MTPGHNFLKGPQKLPAGAQQKYEELSEEYAAIRETIEEMLEAVTSMHEAIEAKLDEAERIRLFAAHHVRMRELRIKAGGYVDRATEFLAVETALNETRRKN